MLSKLRFSHLLHRIAREIPMLCGADDPEVGRFTFRIGDVFHAEDKMARYLVRLSIALGDLRIATGTFAIRPDQPTFERLYFVRLTATHLHELAVLFTPPDDSIPRIDEFISAVIEPDDHATATSPHSAHKHVRQALDKVVVVPGKPKLRSELKRLRNGFLHYYNRRDHEAALIEGIQRAAPIDSAYVIRQKTMRAEYADEVANKLAHPWRGQSDEEWIEAVRSLHEQITMLIGPVSSFLQQAEAAYLSTRRAGTVRWQTKV